MVSVPLHAIEASHLLHSAQSCARVDFDRCLESAVESGSLKLLTHMEVRREKFGAGVNTDRDSRSLLVSSMEDVTGQMSGLRVLELRGRWDYTSVTQPELPS